MARLVVVAGPANSGKTPLMQTLLEHESDLVAVHRDRVRASLAGAPVSEGHLTYVCAGIVEVLLKCDVSVVTIAQNLDPRDRELWSVVAQRQGAEMRWMDTRDPAIHASIPPLDGWTPHSWL